MPDRKKRMLPDHARPRPAHHGFDGFALIFFIAMNRAPGAGAFGFAKGAMGKAGVGVVKKRRAFWAEFQRGAMLIPAPQMYHGRDGILLARYAWAGLAAGIGHGWAGAAPDFFNCKAKASNSACRA